MCNLNRSSLLVEMLLECLWSSFQHKCNLTFPHYRSWFILDLDQNLWWKFLPFTQKKMNWQMIGFPLHFSDDYGHTVIVATTIKYCLTHLLIKNSCHAASWNSWKKLNFSSFASFILFEKAENTSRSFQQVICISVLQFFANFNNIWKAKGYMRVIFFDWVYFTSITTPKYSFAVLQFFLLLFF